MNQIFTLLRSDIEELKGIRNFANRKPKQALEMLKTYFVNENRMHLFFDESQKEELIRISNQYFESDKQRVIMVAEQLATNTFIFQEDWDMERTNIPVTFAEEIDWNYIPYEDPEWVYMLNRHRFLIPLGQAYLFTGDERYAVIYSRLLMSWFKANENKKQSLAWRTIDVGLRISNWIRSFYYFRHSAHFTPELFQYMLVFLYEQGEYLKNNYTNWNAISNWGVIESKALYELSLFLDEFYDTKEWNAISLERLENTSLLQIMKDGMHWEQSPLYHHEVLICYLDVVRLAKRNHQKLSESFLKTVYKMAYASMYMTKPNYHQPMKGDSDSFDLRGIITAAACIFSEPVLKYRGYKQMDFNNMWTFGKEGLLMYDDIDVQQPLQSSRGLIHSGNYFMRSGWGEEDLYLYFHCGQLGGGHGHADLLHIDISAYGRDFLTDLGRFNYSSSSPIRKVLKQPRSHNTTLVDEIDFTEYVNEWKYGRVANPIGTEWITENQFDYVKGSHDGYLHLEDPVYVSREIVFIKPYYWIVVDRFLCQEAHAFTQNFHFAPGSIVLDEKTKMCSTQHKDEPNLHIIPMKSGALHAEIQEGVLSYEYNSLSKNQSVQYKINERGSHSLLQLIYPTKGQTQSLPNITPLKVRNLLGEVMDKANAEAFKIQIPTLKEEHILLLCHQTPSRHDMSYIIEGVQVFGEIVLIKRSKCKQDEVIVIK